MSKSVIALKELIFVCGSTKKPNWTNLSWTYINEDVPVITTATPQDQNILDEVMGGTIEDNVKPYFAF